MDEKVDQVSKWILSYLREDISTEEQQQLDRWIAEHPAHQAMWHKILHEPTLHSDLDYFNRVDTELHWKKISEKLALPVIKDRSAIVRKIYRVSIAAAVTIGIVFTLVYILGPGKNTGITKTGQPVTDTVITPGGDGAILTLSDGHTIIIDSMHNGVLTEQGNAKAIKTSNGELKYETAGETNKAEYHTLTTRRGKQFHVQLDDGTNVWLNAASSLKYPTVFLEKERKVELTGEAYFEVTRNAAKPFIVSVSSGNSKQEIAVLGTHFNVMAYDDEPAIKTSLLEGSVRVTHNAERQTLKPGQQAVLIHDLPTGQAGPQLSVSNVDVEQSLAWKNGYFSFDNTDIKTIMRQIARWYDVEVVYEGNVENKSFQGGLPRSANVSEVLEALEYAGIHFKIQDRKIIVTP